MNEDDRDTPPIRSNYNQGRWTQLMPSDFPGDDAALIKIAYDGMRNHGADPTGYEASINRDHITSLGSSAIRVTLTPPLETRRTAGHATGHTIDTSALNESDPSTWPTNAPEHPGDDETTDGQFVRGSDGRMYWTDWTGPELYLREIVANRGDEPHHVIDATDWRELNRYLNTNTRIEPATGHTIDDETAAKKEACPSCQRPAYGEDDPDTGHVTFYCSECQRRWGHQHAIDDAPNDGRDTSWGNVASKADWTPHPGPSKDAALGQTNPIGHRPTGPAINEGEWVDVGTLEVALKDAARLTDDAGPDYWTKRYLKASNELSTANSILRLLLNAQEHDLIDDGLLVTEFDGATFVIRLTDAQHTHLQALTENNADD